MPRFRGRQEPVFNGGNRQDDLVVLSRAQYEQLIDAADVDDAIREAEEELEDDAPLMDVGTALTGLRKKHFTVFRVRMTRRALRDLDEIYGEIARRLQQPAAVRRAVEALEAELRALGQLPYRSTECQSGAFAGMGYRQFFLRECTAICRIREEEELVDVIAIRTPDRPPEPPRGLRYFFARRRAARRNRQAGLLIGSVPNDGETKQINQPMKGENDMATFKDTVEKLAKTAKERTEDAVETTKLYAKISGEKSNIADLTKQIGALCIEKFEGGAALDEDLVALCEKVKQSKDQIEAYRAEINAIKEAREAEEEPEVVEATPVEEEPAPSADPEAVAPSKCTFCHLPTPPGARFCPHCGQKLIFEE
ncbi:MAG: type II toxin-antitoxin system RelE/ParE family toxin [Oscillospiraceae bacterium]|nr:type II toxin-antitoxin system RelE/ParE family toxin [Oscillospiraceae bacterium]